MTKLMNITGIIMKTDGDDLAWKREFEQVERRQEQRRSKREGWDGKNPLKAWVGNVRTASAWTYSTSHSEQFNED